VMVAELPTKEEKMPGGGMPDMDMM
jgi:hypothetical protein